MNKFEIKKATRSGVVPLIGLYAESGCGKTLSSLLLARGLVGDNGNIVLIDTESGRGSLYSDVLQGGYNVIDMQEPFSPQRYRDAIKAAIAGGAACIIIDSASHEWEGIGGVLDMAHEIEEKTGKPGLHCWKTPKTEHNILMLSILQSPVPIIVCLRAHYKSRQVKNEKGKWEIVKDEYTTPIQSEAFIFEMTIHAEIMKDHTIRLTKCSHPALLSVFKNGEKISVETGKGLAKWCAGSGQTFDAKTAQSSDQLADAKKRLWALTKGIHNGNPETLENHLRTEGMLAEGKRLSDCTASDITFIIEALEGAK